MMCVVAAPTRSGFLFFGWETIWKSGRGKGMVHNNLLRVSTYAVERGRGEGEMENGG